MGRSSTKAPIKNEAEEKPLFLFVPVSEKLRKLSKQLEKAFSRIYPVEIASERRAAAVFLKMPTAFLDRAEEALAYFGICKNRTLPPSFEDYYRRHETRRRVIEGFKEKDAEVSLQHGHNWPDVPLGRNDEAAHEAFRLKLGTDPLERPLRVRRPHFPTAELMIFLEQYLPSDLDEVPGDLANTQEKFCRLPFVLTDLLEKFRIIFRGIGVVRADLIFRERSLYPVVYRAHALLLRLAEIVQETALRFPPHVVTIQEKDNGLVFMIDDLFPALTKTQKDTLAALAILDEEPEFTTTKFATLVKAPAETSRQADQCFINRRKPLAGILPRLAYDPKGGIRRPQGLLFGGRPSMARLEKFIAGNFAVNDEAVA